MNAISFSARFLIVAAGYFLLGAFAFQLALPPGYSAPVWPAAGWALALVLLWGRRVLPAVFLGSFLVNATISGDPSQLLVSWEAWLVPFCIALGAAAQAYLGVWLVRGMTKKPWRLDNLAQILTVVVGGGIFAGTISATVGQTVLVTLGMVDPSAIARNWVAWWAGDAVGVAVLAPIVLLVSSASNARDWRRIATVGATLGLAVLVLIAVLAQLVTVQSETIQKDIDTVAAQSIHTADAKIERLELVLNSVQRFISTDPGLDFHEFLEFTSPLENVLNTVRAIEWLPRVRHEQRDEYEARGRAIFGPGFHFKELSENGYSKAREMAEYYPIFYITPMSGNRNAVGFVVNSEGDRERLIRQAEMNDAVTVSPFVKLVRDGEQVPSLLLTQPVFNDKDLVGFVLIVEEFSDVTQGLEDAARSIGANFIIRYSGDSGSAYSFINGVGSLGSSDIDPGNPEFMYSRTVRFADKELSIEFWLPDAAAAAHAFAGVYFIMVVGMMIVSLFGVLSLLITGERAAIERIVAEKTRELEIAYKKLETISGTDSLTGISNRRRFEEELQREWRRAQREHLPATLALLDLDFFKLLNDNKGHQFGDKALQAVARTIVQQLHRAGDICGRYGGEEFILYFSGASESGALVVLERIRNAVKDLHISNDSDEGEGELTVSIGFVQFRPDDTHHEWEHFVHLADGALYQAKRDGRDRVVKTDTEDDVLDKET